jgi:uncharacterized membrane protein
MHTQKNSKVNFQETRLRSLVKAIIYRVISIAGTSLLSWLITRDLGETFTLTLAIQAFLMVLYYSSERAWDRISWGRQVKTT